MSFGAPQDAVLIKPLVSRPQGTVDPSNTKEETQDLRQDEEAEEYVPNKQQQKNRTRHQKED